MMKDKDSTRLLRAQCINEDRHTIGKNKAYSIYRVQLHPSVATSPISIALVKAIEVDGIYLRFSFFTNLHKVSVVQAFPRHM